jgi:hypothetical protein
MNEMRTKLPSPQNASAIVLIFAISSPTYVSLCVYCF